ncbi:MAG: helix-turn-helix transcriptional regulator [Clostridia bacterium]|nr:helix-turn-helix transcriptional regulator [Clostridia bacterium]
MDARGITRNALAKKINTRFEVISRWYNGDVESMDLDILARILFVLDCSIEDILTYEKPQS